MLIPQDLNCQHLDHIALILLLRLDERSTLVESIISFVVGIHYYVLNIHGQDKEPYKGWLKIHAVIIATDHNPNGSMQYT